MIVLLVMLLWILPMLILLLNSGGIQNIGIEAQKRAAIYYGVSE